MARQVIDLRTQDQRQGITSLQRSAQAIAGILQTIGQAEKVRRERETLDRITRALGEGATTAEAIAAAARQGPQFGTGIQGILQRVGGAFQPPGGGIGQNIQQSIIGAALKRALTPKPQIPPGLEPSGVTVGPRGVTREWAPPKKTQEPFEPTKAQARFDTDARTVINEKKPEPTKQAAENRLRKNPKVNQTLVRSAISDKRFLEITKETKLKKKIGILDKAYGPKAYKKALKTAIREGLSEGFTAESTEQVFKDWWDEQVTKTGGVFKEFLPRAEASQGTQKISDTDVRLQSAPDVRLDSIWSKLSTEQKRQILTQIDQNPQNLDAIITNILARIQGASS